MQSVDFGHGMLYCGDCLEVMPEIIEDHSIDMINADLPYNTTAAQWDKEISLKKLWPEYKRIIKKNAVIALSSTQPFTSFLVMSNLNMYKYELVWDKVCAVGHLVAYKRIMAVHETIQLFYEGQCIYHPQFTIRDKKALRPNRVKNRLARQTGGKTELVKNCPKTYYAKNYDDTKVFPKSILRYTKRISYAERIHSTQKPVGLYEYLIRTFTDEGDTVLDNVIGSGTTAIAAYNTGRKWIGIEKDPKIFEQACLRIERETQQQNIFNEIS